VNATPVAYAPGSPFNSLLRLHLRDLLLVGVAQRPDAEIADRPRRLIRRDPERLAGRSLHGMEIFRSVRVLIDQLLASIHASIRFALTRTRILYH